MPGTCGRAGCPSPRPRKLVHRSRRGRAPALQEAAVTISPQLPRQRGSKGKGRAFECRKKLKVALEKCFEELFEIWNRDNPSIILTAGERKTPEVSGSRALGLIVTTTKGNDVFKELNLD
jgi:hypothetical protein